MRAGTRGLVCKLHEKKRTRAYRSSGSIRLSLRGSLRLIRDLPGDQDLLVTVIRACWRELDANLEASGPHDFTVRLQAPSSGVPSASTASPPRAGDVAQRPSEWDGMAIDIA